MRRHLIWAMAAALSGCADSQDPVAEPPVLDAAVSVEETPAGAPTWRLSEEPISDDGTSRTYAIIDAETGETVDAVFVSIRLPVPLPHDACRGMSEIPKKLPDVPVPGERTPVVSEPSELPAIHGPGIVCDGLLVDPVPLSDDK